MPRNARYIRQQGVPKLGTLTAHRSHTVSQVAPRTYLPRILAGSGATSKLWEGNQPMSGIIIIFMD
jgi:hypothetical protein